MTPRRYVICDIEATGLDEDREIIEIALITYQDGQITDVYETLINPLRSVPNFIRDLTAISIKDLEQAPKFYEVAEAIMMRLEGSVFVSHNTEFDFEILKRKFNEMGQELGLKTFCTLKVAQHEIPGLRNYNLDALCSFFGIKIQERHRAIGDARATLQLFLELFQLRLKTYSKTLYLPHHEKAFKKVPRKAGLLTFRDLKGRTIHMEAAINMEKRAQELLEVKAENRNLLIKTETIEAEVTGSPLIAEFKKILYQPYTPRWVVTELMRESGERYFAIRPYKKAQEGLWFFRDYVEAKRKIRELEAQLKDHIFAYRDGGKSKEEILKQNQKVEALSREARFPSDNLIILGEGRTIGEKSFILVRHGHVIGFGYSEKSTEEIMETPESFLTRRFFQHLGANLKTKRYIRELKNMRQKTDGWRSLAEVR